MNSRTLVTGFGPFKDVPLNPSTELAERTGRTIQILEVSYEKADQFVWSLDPDSFDVWLMLGVAASRKFMAMELFARNIKRGKDVAGREEQGVIEAGAPLILDSTLWTPEIAANLTWQERPNLTTSMDAGAYLCNYLSYRALRHFPQKQLGFLHVVLPDIIPLDEQSNKISTILQYIE